MGLYRFYHTQRHLKNNEYPAARFSTGILVFLMLSVCIDLPRIIGSKLLISFSYRSVLLRWWLFYMQKESRFIANTYENLLIMC